MIGGSELAVLLFIWGLPFIIVLVALVDILRSEFQVRQNKLIWALVTLLLPLIGALLYFIIGRSQRTK